MQRALRVLALSVVAVSGCDDAAECSDGELRYSGRPPRRLFSYDTSCRKDCFSQPRSNASCEQVCGKRKLARPPGLILDDRTLMLFDLESLEPGRGLVYQFGYLDEAGGTAPEGWTYFSAGPQAYLSDQLDSTARFMMWAWVTEFGTDCAGRPGTCESGEHCVEVGEAFYCARNCVAASEGRDPCEPGRSCLVDDQGARACDGGGCGLQCASSAVCGAGLVCSPQSTCVPRTACLIDGPIELVGERYVSMAPTGDAAQVAPGRLEVHEISAPDAVIYGTFYLAWETATGQPQGQVAGCFNLEMGEPDVEGGKIRRVLSPND